MNIAIAELYGERSDLQLSIVDRELVYGKSSNRTDRTRSTCRPSDLDVCSRKALVLRRVGDVADPGQFGARGNEILLELLELEAAIGFSRILHVPYPFVDMPRGNGRA